MSVADELAWKWLERKCCYVTRKKERGGWEKNKVAVKRQDFMTRKEE